MSTQRTKGHTIELCVDLNDDVEGEAAALGGLAEEEEPVGAPPVLHQVALLGRKDPLRRLPAQRAMPPLSLVIVVVVVVVVVWW